MVIICPTCGLELEPHASDKDEERLYSCLKCWRTYKPDRIGIPWETSDSQRVNGHYRLGKKKGVVPDAEQEEIFRRGSEGKHE